MERKLPIINFAVILLRHKKALFYNALIVGIVSLIISLLLPKWYKADTLFILPESKTNTGISSILGAFPIDFGYNVSQEGEKFITLLYSRQVIDALIDTFQINKTFKYKYRYLLRKYIRKSIISHEMYDDGSIRITVVYPSDPVKPAEMANFLVKRLDKLYKKLKSRQAYYQRIFLEKQYQDLKQELFTLEDSLSRFQQKYKLFDLEEQLKGEVDLIAQLQFEKIQTDIALKVLEKTFNQNHPEVLQLKQKRRALENQIEEILSSGRDKQYIASMKEIPELSLSYLRLLRDIKIKEKILEFLIPQLEQAKVEEVKNTPVIQVVDAAIPAEYKYKPKRAFIVLGTVFIFLVLHVGIILSRIYIQNRMAADEEFARKVEELRQHLRFRK